MRYSIFTAICCFHLFCVSAATDSIPELPLPKVPMTLREPADRADYIITHFWDAMDFRDTLHSHNMAFMEQNFSNFISVFPYANEAAHAAAVDSLMHKAEADSTAYTMLADIAEKYLYDLNSPVSSEAFYLLFLRQIINSPIMASNHRTTRLLYRLEALEKNRPGMTAADFSYVTRDGRQTTLHSTKHKGDLLLIFYDPDCEHCKEIMERLRKDTTLKRMVADRKLAVLAIYSGDDHDLWVKTAPSLPDSWTVGYEPGTMQENGSYVLRAMPTFYLLDNKKVIQKDAPF